MPLVPASTYEKRRKLMIAVAKDKELRSSQRRRTFAPSMKLSEITSSGAVAYHSVELGDLYTSECIHTDSLAIPDLAFQILSLSSFAKCSLCSVCRDLFRSEQPRRSAGSRRGPRRLLLLGKIAEIRICSISEVRAVQKSAPLVDLEKL